MIPVTERVQTCKDCGGDGIWPIHGLNFVCETCGGSGSIHRTGPYRLQDGSWSDGVWREQRITSDEHMKNNRLRWVIYKSQIADGEWYAATGDGGNWTIFPTVEAAIDYADKAARRQG